ncbi:transposase, partial [Escherichia coli]
MDEKQLQALANELAKNLKTPEDLSQFDRLLKKLSVEAALNAEMTHHPGYEKNQTRITGMDNQILSLYAKGMTTREIAAAFKELYDADVSPALISKVTDAVMEQVVEWQNRP